MLLVTAHVKVCHLAYDVSIREFLAGDVCIVNLFRIILPVVPAECDVLIVCRQHNDKEWKSKEQHAKMWENIAEAKRYSRPRGFNIAGASAPGPGAPAVPTPLKIGRLLKKISNMNRRTLELRCLAIL